MCIIRQISVLSVIKAVILLPVTFLFYAAVRIRHFLYDSGMISSYLSDTVTISVGNITAGGTGKTPHIIEMARELSVEGKRVAVVSRGYKRRSSGRIEVNESTDARTAGDEPLTIYKKTGVKVICDADRVSAVRSLEGSADYILLDDAFQHRRIRKHLDIVLIDQGRFLGNGLLLPSGILRDIPSRLKKCSSIILTKTADPLKSFPVRETEYLKKFNKPVYLSEIKYSSLKNYDNEMDPDGLTDMKVAVFCGIADPGPFFDFLEKFHPVFKKSYQDHAEYGQSFASDLESMSRISDIIVTTYKDFVKLGKDHVDKYNVRYLDISLNLYDCGLKLLNIKDLLKGSGLER